MSFVPVPPGSDFTLANLPYGVCIDRGSLPWTAVRLGDHVINLSALQRAGCFSGPVLSKNSTCFQKGTLNEFLSLGKPAWAEARSTLTRLLSSSEGLLRDDACLRQQAVRPVAEVHTVLPMSVGDYTDFYASKHHATNVGAMFRSREQALNPNWLHLPVGYHGRSSSIIVSGSSVYRPVGQLLPAGASVPVMGASQAVDFELEMACVMGTGNGLGSPLPVDRAADNMCGLVLMNDWSARDIQKWEYVPLGPFNAKNWATQVSPWVVTLEALEPFRCEAPAQEPAVLPYLQEEQRYTWDVQLSCSIIPSGGAAEAVVTQTNLKYMYWTFQQMVAHHTCGGCNLRPGDMLGCGTISGPEPHERACLLELTQGGKDPLQLVPGAAGTAAAAAAACAGAADGQQQQRAYLLDGDEVVIRGWCVRDGVDKVGFGECRGRLLPARPV